MNQSNHPIQGFTLSPASVRSGTDEKIGFIQRSETIKWAGAFYNNAYQPICILELPGHEIIYTNQAFKSHINKNFAEQRLSGVLTEDSGQLVSRAIASLNGEPSIVSGIFLASEPGRVYELNISRLLVDEKLISITFTPVATTEKHLAEKKLLNELIKLPGQAFCVQTRDGIFKMVNNSFAAMLGYDVEDMIGRHFTEFLYEADKSASLYHLNQNLLKTFSSHGFEDRYLTKTGEIKWFSWSATYLPEEELLIASPTDITRKKDVEQNLLTKTVELQNVVSSLDDVVFEYDQEGNFRKYWCNNDSILQLMPKEYAFKSMQEAYHALPELTGNFIHDFENALSKNEICYRDFSLEIDEETLWFNSKITPLFDNDGEAIGFSQRITDISDKKKVELAISEKNQELKSAHRELRDIIENTSEIIFKLNLDHEIIFVSPEFERSLGFPGSRIIGKHISSIIHADHRERFETELSNARKSGKSTTHNIFRALERDGVDRWFNVSAKFVRNSKGEPFIGIVFAQDISDLKLTMDSLSASEERYRSVVNALGEGVVMHDSKGLIIACNHAAEKIFDLPTGGALGDIMHRPTIHAIREDGSDFPVREFPAAVTLTTGEAIHGVVMGIYKRNGDLVWIVINTEPVYYTTDRTTPDAVVASLFDITEKKKSEETLSAHTKQLQDFSDKISGILDSITDGFIALDSSLKVTLWNKVMETETGISQYYATGKKIGDLNCVMLNDAVAEVCREATRHYTTKNFEHFVPDLDRWFEYSIYPLGEGLFIYLRDITGRKQQENLLALEKRVLEHNASQAASLKTTVDYFLEGLEEIFPGMLCSVLILDEDGKSMRHLSAPKLPQEYTDKINGLQIGPKTGSCGTAMFTKNRVIVTDISTDPLWEDYKQVAAPYNLAACWSFPIKNSHNQVLATIATYHRQPATPTPFQLQIIERVENLLKVIIENKKSDFKIRMSNERYLLATRATNDAIWDYDVVSDSIFHGDGYANIFGYKAGRTEEPIRDWARKIHPDDHDRVVNGFRRFMKASDHKHWEDEYRYLHANGNYVLVYDRGFLIFNQEAKVARVVGSMQDITEKKNLERQVLKQELDKQKMVAQAVVDAQEKERAEIGKELHDNVNQILSTAKLYLELARSDENERLNLIKRSGDNIFDAINEIRAISRSLVPPSIGDLGILVSIQDLMENIRATKKLHVEFYYSEGIEAAVNEKQQLMLFRIIQEQVNNVLKHAEATNLIIELMVEGPIVDLTISDNGKGFDKENNKNKRGVGLNNIASRTELFNGKVNLITAPGKGCTLNIHIPITNV